jgi:hypothetical protein
MSVAYRMDWRGRSGLRGHAAAKLHPIQKEKAPSLFRLPAFAVLLTDPMLFWSALAPSDLRLPMSQVSSFMNFRPFERHSSELSPFRVFVLSNFPVSFVNPRYDGRHPDSKFLPQQLCTGLAHSYAHGCRAPWVDARLARAGGILFIY